MNKSQLKKLIQEIAFQEIKIVKNTPRFKKEIDDYNQEVIIYVSPKDTEDTKIEGHSQRDDDDVFVTPFPPNPILFGVMGSLETEIDESFLEMLQYLDQNGIKYNIQTYADEGDVETYISVSLDSLEKRNLIQ
jgi:hypothetical protein